MFKHSEITDHLHGHHKPRCQCRLMPTTIVLFVLLMHVASFLKTKSFGILIIHSLREWYHEGMNQLSSSVYQELLNVYPSGVRHLLQTIG